MKEKIYTIPVTDAFNENGECAFCNMKENLERDSIEFMLGPSYMEDDIRMETNKKGFCKNHYEDMYNNKNRLGLALMLHSHIQQINKDLNNMKSFSHEKRGLFSKNKTEKNNIPSYLYNIQESCYICDKINRMFDRYIETFFFLWMKDQNIKTLVKSSKGFCLEHYSLLLTEGEKKLTPAEFKKFMDILIPKQLENLKRIEDELDWFIKKFDYRFENEPWKNSKDALPRALEKLSSTKIK